MLRVSFHPVELPLASDTRWLGQALAPDVCGEGQEGATGCKWGWAGGAGHSDICGHVPAGQVGSIVLEEKKQVIISVWGSSVDSGRTAIYNSVLSVPLPYSKMIKNQYFEVIILKG